MTQYVVRHLLFIIAFGGACLGQTSSTADWFTDLKGENTGHTVANFLTLPIGAGNLAVGELATTGMMDATDIPLRPANTGFFTFQKLAATHCEWLMDTRSEFAGACFPLIDIGTIGGYFRLFTPGSFANARDIDQEPSHPSMLEYALGASYGCSFFEKSLALGAAVSYVESRLDETAGRSAIATIDASFRPSPLVNIHVGVSNLGPPITYVAAKEPLPAQVDLSAEIHPFALKEETAGIINLSIGCGVRKISDQALGAGGGLQVCLFRQFTMRAGYDYNVGSHPSIVGLSAGAGVDVGIYGADFGWKDVSEDLGSVWGVSVRMNLKEVMPKTAEEYYRTAEKYYSSHNVRLCVYNAKKALRLNPNMWKAHALIAMASAEQRREKNIEVALIYTGNTQGQFLPLPAAKGTVGGLARQATVIKQLARQFPTHIIIDGGNIITEATHPLKTKLSQIFYDELKYDAVSVGEKESRYGLSKLFPPINRMKTEFVYSNLISRFGLGNVVSKRTVEKNGYQFFVLSMVAPGLLASPAEREKLFVPQEEIAHNLAMSVAKNASARIIVLHDSWQNIASSYNTLFRPNDIIIAASLKQEFATPMKVGGAIVLSPGEYGKYVGYCVMRFTGDKKLISCENHLVPLTEDVPSDSSIETRTRLVAGKVDFDSLGIGEQDLKRSSTGGVFAFCSRRNGVKALYLKVVPKSAEFLLTSGNNDCGNPVVSFPASRIAYVEHDPADACPVLSLMDLAGTGKRRVPLVTCPRSVAFTPDGAWLYFSAKMNDSTSDIFRMKPDGAVISPVIEWKNSNEGAIAFSRDGRSMTFGSNANGKWQLFVSDPDGQKPVCITDGSADFVAPAYSPDGKHVGLLSNKTSFGGTFDLWVYEFATSGLSQISHGARVRDFCWLDNATALATCGGDTSVLTSFSILTRTSSPFIGSAKPKDYAERCPVVVPYGTSAKIVYTREYFDNTMRIFWVNPDGTGDECIVTSGTQDWLE